MENNIRCGVFLNSLVKATGKTLVGGLLVFALCGWINSVRAENAGILGSISAKGEKGNGPVQEGEVVILRFNPRGKWVIKADKDGNYAQHGLTPYKQYYVIVSGVNCTTEIRGPLTLNGTTLNLNFELKPGNGKRLTETEIEAFLNNGGIGNQETPKPEVTKVNVEKGNSKGNFDEMKKLLETGVSLVNKKKYEEAIVTFKQALVADSGYFEVYQNLGTALTSLGGDQLVAGTKARDNAKKEAARQAYQEAATVLEKAVSLAATDSRSLGPKAAPGLKLHRAEVLTTLGEYFSETESAQKAVLLFQEAVTGFPNGKERNRCLLGLGKAYRFADKLDYGAETLRELVKNEPNLMEAAFELAKILTIQDPEMKDVVKQQEALALYAKVADKANDPQVKAEAGAVAAFLKENLKSAIEAAKK
ncbi:MAG: hypothetical protein K1Y36_16020 [Blastocatellia bacterium]|nr:hypothetical protein [Blastocatellia bacterium]